MLNKIIEDKKEEVEILKSSQQHSLVDVLDMKIEKRQFYNSLKNKIESGKNAIIAELKKHSPSKGVLNKNLDIAEFAKLYEESGAACISVLTDQIYFNGKIDDLITAKNNVKVPILRKDFIIDESQIIQSKIIGADCILLIVACLSKRQLHDFLSVSKQLDMEVLVEVHDRNELDIALESGCKIIGINNRDLKTFNVSINTSLELCKAIKDNDVIVVSESGIKDIETIEKLNSKNIKSFLVGESLIMSSKPKLLLETLVG
tara:strand:- start:2740 stop:3519 length:780 start_codon:yes stop_codon:yes gene_type:complete